MTTREKILKKVEKEFPELKQDLIDTGYDYDQVMDYIFDEVDTFNK